MKRLIAFSVLSLGAAMPLATQAQEAVTVHRTPVFAGPSSEFPEIATLPRDVSVQVFGCLRSWSWCDVGFARDRGWVYSDDIAYLYRGDRVVIMDYGPRIGIPVLSFSLATYWDNHYRGQRFYRDRDHWSQRVAIETDRGGPPPSGSRITSREESQTQPGATQGSAESRASRESSTSRESSASRESTGSVTGATGTDTTSRTQPSTRSDAQSRAQSPAGTSSTPSTRPDAESRAQSQSGTSSTPSQSDDRSRSRAQQSQPPDASTRQEPSARSDREDRSAKGEREERKSD